MPQSHIDVEWTLVETAAAKQRDHDWSAATVVNEPRPLRYGRLWRPIVALFCRLAVVDDGDAEQAHTGLRRGAIMRRWARWRERNRATHAD